MRRKPTSNELRKAAASVRLEDAPNPRLGPSLVVEGPAPSLTRVPSKNSTRGREERSSVKDKEARDADEPRMPFANEVIQADALEAVLAPGDGNPSRTQGFPKFADDPADAKLADHRAGDVEVAAGTPGGVTELEQVLMEQGKPQPSVKTDKTKMNDTEGDVRADGVAEPVDPERAEDMKGQKLSEQDLVDRPTRKKREGK